MKVPYFDIRSHFLLWMILSKVFSMYINTDRHFFAVRHVDYRGEKDWWQIWLDYTLFSLPVFHVLSKRKQWLREILVYWHTFRRKHGRFQMQVSEHKMYLIFWLYRLERLRVNTNPKN